MKRPVLAALAAAVLVSTGSMVSAGPIEKACNRSDRSAATRALCGCIQQAADLTLNGSDQRRAAKFFSDPDLAHTVRFSKKTNDDAFWKRYRQFTDMAEAYCAG
ncbi:hypothetical protein [Pseudogemmobacter sonorensis]|uniref:hypothetical protein n=1 Tax=Pseudogemmobacter sonorensis TaxID=2989681 RepID=UPI003F671F31